MSQIALVDLWAVDPLPVEWVKYSTEWWRAVTLETLAKRREAA